MKKLVPILFFAMLLTACSSIECPLNNVVSTVFTLRKDSLRPDTLLDTLTVYTKRSDGTDTILVNKLIGVSEFDIPMGHTSEKDELYFVIGEFTDKVTITKTNQPHFESVDCTPSYFHTITDIQFDGSLIKNIIIKNAEVTYDSTTNCYLILKRPY